MPRLQQTVYRKIDLGETLNKILRREVHEKIRLTLKNLRVKFIFYNSKYNYNIYIIKLKLIEKS